MIGVDLFQEFLPNVRGRLRMSLIHTEVGDFSIGFDMILKKFASSLLLSVSIGESILLNYAYVIVLL